METIASDFAIKTPVFEGPLDLLIDLVEKRKLLINDISLAEVTDEYMAHVAQMQEQSLPGTVQFINLAATLLLIKSRSLLPVLELTDAEEESIENLEARLKLYQIYRNAGAIVAESFGVGMLHESQFVPSDEPLFKPDKYTETDSLQAAIADVIQNLPKKEVKPKVRVKPTISLDEMIDRLRDRVEKQMKSTLTELTEGSQERTTVIVGFLAVLEMVKQGQVNVIQPAHFDDIHIHKDEVQTPRYY